MSNNLISYLYPQEVETLHSEFNGPITVMRFLGQPFVVVDDLTQSGGLVTKIWSQVVNQLSQKEFSKQSPGNILILGLGAGSMVKKIHRTWPQSHITGVEIDPVMIEIGNKYFDLENYPLTLINQDAMQWIGSANKIFDLTLIDLYMGKESPHLTNKKFITQVKTHLSSGGIAVFNHLTLKGKEKKAAEFHQPLQEYFDQISTIPTSVNRLVKAQNHP